MKPLKFIHTLNEIEPEMARREYITRNVLFFTFSVTFSFALVSFILYLSDRMPLDTLLIYTIESIILIVAMFLTEAGFWRVVGIIPPLLMYFPAINANYIGGIDAPGNFMYALMIIFVAIIYGYRKMWIALVICLMTYLCLAWMISSGHIKPFRTAEVVFVNRVVLTSGFLVGIALMIWLLGRSYRSEIDVRIKAEELLKRKNEELGALNTALQESEEKYRSIFDNAAEGFFQSTPEGHFIAVNPAFAQIFGYASTEELVSTISDISQQYYVNREDRLRYMEILQEKGMVENLEFKARRKDGAAIWISNSTRAIAGKEGKIIRYDGIVQNINARKLAEEALKKSEGKYRLIAENSTDVIWTMSLDGRFTYVSPSVTMHAGYTPEEAMAMTIETYMYEEDLPWVMQVLYQEMQKPRGERDERRILEIRQYKKDGALLDVEVSVAWLYDERGEIVGLQGSTRDITARKQAEEARRKLEERLIQAQKMESIGTLAGGIAHDFNNLLMGIQGYASLMLMDLDVGQPHYEKLRAIEKQVASGADLTRQLLGFARGGRYDVKTADINEVLSKAAAIFGRTKKEIRMHEKYGDDLRPVDVDRGQMDQVLLNLFVNAWQAMPGGGDLFLETDNVNLDDAFVSPYEIRPGPYVKFTVTDTGGGMDEKTQQRIFDPFFTTKKMGRGTGLGLATVYGIVKGHGGMVHVDSKPGHGATFTIYLPVSEKVVEREQKKTETIARGTETILLVDDEKVVLDVGRELLKFLGYGVYVADSGQEAIAVYLEKYRAIDLVILDMIMPGISGGETFERLREINPEIRVLLSSGYSLEGQAQQILDRGCDGFLQKPFSLEVISQKVREILD